MIPLRFKGFIELVCRRYFGYFGDNAANILRDFTQVLYYWVQAMFILIDPDPLSVLHSCPCTSRLYSQVSDLKHLLVYEMD
jgi:hypothetical protein